MSQVSKAQMGRWIAASVRWVSSASMVGTICIGSSFATERDPQVVKALSYTPRQSNIAYDKVAEKDIDSCSSKYETRSGFEGLVIYNADGQPIRRFADGNSDRQVDQWCYYKDGIEIYRDIDSDFNGAADQYRWLGTGGTRWGIDKNEDGKIEQWKVISAEEVTMEIVEAIKLRDDERFRKLLVSDSELKILGLGEDKGDQLTSRLDSARKGFAEFAKTQKLITVGTKWAHFAADKPGIVPAGTEGAAQDIVAYENVIAIVDNDGTSQQLMVGTLVQIGSAWRLADLPRTINADSVLADSGLFFPASASNRTSTTSSESGLSQEVQRLLTDLEKLEDSIKDEAGDRAKLHEEKAKVLLKLIAANKGTDQMELWIKQFADSISSATQSGEYPEGVEKLRLLVSQLGNMPKGKEFVPYVAYRLLSTEYTLKSALPKADYARLQSEYMEKLETFAGEYPESIDSADALIQIGLNLELAGDEPEAEKWYRKVSTKFPESIQGRKAYGAIARLSLEGRQFRIAGKTLDGKQIDTKTMAKTPVLVHYWASWCGPCKEDMAELRKIQAKYSRQNLQIIGVNLDTDPRVAKEALDGGKSFPWPHIQEQGGFESDLAVGLGVLSVPVTILIDGDGKVAKRTSHFSKAMSDALEALMAVPLPQQAIKPQAPIPPNARKAQQPSPADKKK
jgi:thiol-disulfide isomerase/thioredoxin